MASADTETRNWAGLVPAVLAALALLILPVGASAASPNWIDPVDLSPSVSDASNPDVAMDSAGGTVALWEQTSTSGPGVGPMAVARAAGIPFGSPFELSTRGNGPRLAMTPAGEAVAAWKRVDSTLGTNTIVVATKPPGGSFSPPVTVYAAPPGLIPQEIGVAIGAAGDVAVTWRTVDPNAEFDQLTCIEEFEGKEVERPCPNPYFVMASVRPAGGVFSEPVQISPARGTGEEGEDEGEREEREIAESAMTAGGARPIVDGAGNTTVSWTYFDGSARVVQAAVRPAGGGWEPPAAISEASEPGEGASSVDLGIDGAGNAIVSWAQREGTGEGAPRIVHVGVKPPGGSFSVLPDVSPPGQVAQGPVLGVSPSGEATVVWLVGVGEQRTLYSATRPPGGSFSVSEPLSSGSDGAIFHDVAAGDHGAAIVVWSGDEVAGGVVRAAVRAPGAAAFGSPVPISQTSSGFVHPKPSMDAAGDATVVWERDDVHRVISMAGYDVALPVLGAVSVPSTATVAEPVTFSATSFDVWPAGPPTFAFGDGAATAGTTVFHAFAAPGTYTVTVTAADALGKSASTARSVLVRARNYFRIGKLKRNRRKGTATLLITVPEPGTLTVNGRWVKRVRKRVRPGTARIPLRAVGKGLRRLRARGRLRVRLRIAYAPVGGDVRVKHRRVTLRSKVGHSRKSRPHNRRARHR
jgi:PKD domain